MRNSQSAIPTPRPDRARRGSPLRYRGRCPTTSGDRDRDGDLLRRGRARWNSRHVRPDRRPRGCSCAAAQPRDAARERDRVRLDTRYAINTSMFCWGRGRGPLWKETPPADDLRGGATPVATDPRKTRDETPAPTRALFLSAVFAAVPGAGWSARAFGTRACADGRRAAPPWRKEALRRELCQPDCFRGRRAATAGGDGGRLQHRRRSRPARLTREYAECRTPNAECRRCGRATA